MLKYRIAILNTPIGFLESKLKRVAPSANVLVQRTGAQSESLCLDDNPLAMVPCETGVCYANDWLVYPPGAKHKLQGATPKTLFGEFGCRDLDTVEEYCDALMNHAEWTIIPWAVCAAYPSVALLAKTNDAWSGLIQMDSNQWQIELSGASRVVQEANMLISTHSVTRSLLETFTTVFFAEREEPGRFAQYSFGCGDLLVATWEERLLWEWEDVEYEVVGRIEIEYHGETTTLTAYRPLSAADFLSMVDCVHSGAPVFWAFPGTVSLDDVVQVVRRMEADGQYSALQCLGEIPNTVPWLYGPLRPPTDDSIVIGPPGIADSILRQYLGEEAGDSFTVSGVY